MQNILITNIATDLKLIARSPKAMTAASCEGPIGFQGAEPTTGRAAFSFTEVFSVQPRIR